MTETESKHLQDFKSLLSRGGYVLFVGAGVGVEAGLPSWQTALHELADALAEYSNPRALVMREEIGQNRYPYAAEEFYSASEVLHFALSAIRSRLSQDSLDL